MARKKTAPDHVAEYLKNAAKEFKDYLEASNAAGAANAARNDGPPGEGRLRRAAAADVATAKWKKERSEMFGAILQARRYR